MNTTTRHETIPQTVSWSSRRSHLPNIARQFPPSRFQDPQTIITQQSTGISRTLLCRHHRKRRRRQFSTTEQSNQSTTQLAKDNTTTTTTSTSSVETPSFKTLRSVAITTGIPFIGFGFMDNAILVIAGDAIDTSLGVMLGISTLCAAAIGNIISDLAGIGLGAWIEDFCANTLKMPVPQLTQAQRQLRSVRFASQGGMAIGMTFGCIIGMFPLLFMDSVHKQEHLRKRAELETLFKDVVTDAKTLVGAESTCLYLRVDNNNDKDGNDEDFMSKYHHQPWYRRWTSPSYWWNWISSSVSTIFDSHSSTKGGITILPYKPSVDGEYLYSMYYPITERKDDFQSDSQQQQVDNHDDNIAIVSDKGQDDIATISRIIPVGRGIVSRAMLTGDTWNIVNLNREPDFFPPPLATVNNKPPSTTSTSSSNDGGGSGSDTQHRTNHGHHPPHLATGVIEKVHRPEYRNMVVVPILDGQGRAIAVIEARNKIGIGSQKRQGPIDSSSVVSPSPSSSSSSWSSSSSFTDQDVEILKSLASHISVNLQLTYQVVEDGDGRGRLKDTIQIMKGLGLQHEADEKENNNISTTTNQHHRRIFGQPYRRGGGGDGNMIARRGSKAHGGLFPATPLVESQSKSTSTSLSTSNSKLFPDEN